MLVRRKAWIKATPTSRPNRRVKRRRGTGANKRPIREPVINFHEKEAIRCRRMWPESMFAESLTPKETAPQPAPSSSSPSSKSFPN